MTIDGKIYNFGNSKSILIGTNNLVKATYLVRNKNGGVGSDAKLTIRKVDYDDNSLLNDFKFAIFKKDDGWLGYDTTTKKVTYGNSWQDAGKFRTGRGYCNIASYDGEFTLSGLYYGYYYVFEIETNGEYSLKGQQGCNITSGNALFYNDDWKMENNGVPVNRILCGWNTWKLGYLDVGMQDGSSYDFRFSNSREVASMACIRLANYEGPYEYRYKEFDEETNEEIEKTEIRNATKHATYTIKNRKDTELKIVKKDSDTKDTIEGVGIKVLVYLRENIKDKDTDGKDIIKYPTQQWYWLNSDRSLTKDYKEATTFRTNNEGTIDLTKVPYGIYRIYEVEAASGYKLQDQQGYKKPKPDTYNLDDNREEKFFDGEYVDLGRKIIIPKASKKNNVVLDGYYNIQYNANTNYVIDLLDEKNQDPNTRWGVKLYKYAQNSNEDGYSGQTIKVSYVERGNYLLFNEYSKKYIACQTDSEDNERLKDAIIEDSQQGRTENFTFSRQQWEFILNENDGSFNIKTRAGGKEETNLHLYGGNTVNGTRIILNKPEGSEKQKFRLKQRQSIYQVPTDENGNRIIEFEVENKPASIKLIINKVDATYQTDTGANNEIRLSGAEFKIYGTKFKDNSSPGWIKQTNEDGVIKTEYKSYSEATTFTTNNDGELEIKQLKKGEYHIFETKAPKGYDLKAQEGYKDSFNRDEINEIPGASEIKNQDWVYQEKVITNDVDNTVTLFNTKYVSLKGKVWLDNPSGKANSYNSLYDEGDWINQNENITKDVLLDGLTVNLCSTKNGKVIETTRTNDKGEYEFKYVEKDDPIYENNKIRAQLTYWELAYCYVEFIYDNREYVIATPFIGDNVQINSKAQELEITNEELYDYNLTGTDGVLPGKAVTNPGLTGILNNTIIDNNKNAENSGKILTSFYNDETYTIEDINLGLFKKIDPSFEVGQQIEYVKIKRGSYEFTYRMRR